MGGLVLRGACALAITSIAVGMLAGCASAGSGSSDAGLDSSINGTLGDGALVDGGPMSCAAPDTCQTTALMLGSISGDTQNQKLTASGHRGAWYRVRVTENNNAIGGLKLRAGANLTLSAGPMFDVFVYVNPANDVVECSTVAGTPAPNGNIKQARAEWGEGALANGDDDSRTITVEIRPLAQTGCTPTAQWQLEVEGNWN